MEKSPSSGCHEGVLIQEMCESCGLKELPEEKLEGSPYRQQQPRRRVTEILRTCVFS